MSELGNVSVLGQRVDVTSYDDAVDRIIGWSRNGERRYVCVSNVHMVMEGHDDVRFRELVNGADLITPDGMPLVWAMRIAGSKDATRVRGFRLMPLLLAAAEREHISVGFFGSKEDVLTDLVNASKAKYPTLDVAYHLSPPFRPLTKEEDDALVDSMNASGARLIFVGLGCPKQETWMAEHSHRVRAVLVGTGGAFDFLAGDFKEAPVWMQNTGLEWVFRFAAEPRRLWRRYLRHNPRFVALLARQQLRRLVRGERVAVR
ncbi:MAG: WecB/TagA/CpsF family glycosyltransferase [Kofleriaceae bacterium]|nr:WecB/TagA/CpsF family glycosyltransferase [Kofleriaceae bacterium]